MIGGNTSFGSGGWDQTVWDGLIPVDMSGQGPAPFQNHFSVIRGRHPSRKPPITHLEDCRRPGAKPQALGLPDFLRNEPDRRLKPAATALGLSEGPAGGLRRCDRLLLPVVRPRPDIRDVQRLPRSTGEATSSTLGRSDNRYFRKFWRNVVRWLAENSDRSQQRLRVETDKIIYRPGQDIWITAEAPR